MNFEDLICKTTNTFTDRLTISVNAIVSVLLDHMVAKITMWIYWYN